MFTNLSDEKSASRAAMHFIEVEPESVPQSEVVIEIENGFRLRIADAYGAALAAQFVSSLRAADQRAARTARNDREGGLS